MFVRTVINTSLLYIQPGQKWGQLTFFACIFQTLCVPEMTWPINKPSHSDSKEQSTTMFWLEMTYNVLSTLNTNQPTNDRM